MSTQTAPPSPELDLLLACARVASADDAAERVAALLQGPLHWPRLIPLADGHGMLPLLAHHLRPHAALVPAREQQGLAQYALRNASSILMLTRELLELLRLFRDADILAVPYKGPVLALQLYGNLALRKAGDLDVLIRKADVPRARDLLLAHGYRHRRKLSPAASRIWSLIQAETPVAAVRDQLLDEYPDVPSERITQDLLGMLSQLLEWGVIHARTNAR